MVKISFQGAGEKIVKAVGRYIPVSPKTSSEVARFIKNKKIDKAIEQLERVAAGELPIPFKRRKRDIPHRKGPMAAGRFPKKASLEFIKLLKQVKANAKDQGLGEDLIVIHAAAQKAPKVSRYGRQRGRIRKLAHLELVAKEVEGKAK